MVYKNRFNKLIILEGYQFNNNSAYKKSREHVSLRHIKCGHVFKVTPDSFSSGSRCPDCSGNRKLTREDLELRITKFVGSEYSLLGDYINSKTKVRIRHNNDSCNYYEYDVLFNSFINGGSYCHRCSGRERLNTEKYIDRVKKMVSNEYTVLGEYINSDTPILMRHNNENCGNHEWEIRPYNFTGKERNRCPACFGTGTYNSSTFNSEVLSLSNGEYTVLGDYINAHVRIKLRHNSVDCNNHEWIVLPHSFIRGSRCPRCAVVSRGERKVTEYLTRKGNEFETEVTFNDCRTTRPLPFDFGIYDDGVLIKLIEYHGIQHYQPVEQFGGNKEFENRQRNDNIKRSYCKDNNIPLIEIHYKDFDNIEVILNKELK